MQVESRVMASRCTFVFMVFVSFVAALPCLTPLANRSARSAVVGRKRTGKVRAEFFINTDSFALAETRAESALLHAAPGGERSGAIRRSRMSVTERPTDDERKPVAGRFVVRDFRLFAGRSSGSSRMGLMTCLLAATAL